MGLKTVTDGLWTECTLSPPALSANYSIRISESFRIDQVTILAGIIMEHLSNLVNKYSETPTAVYQHQQGVWVSRSLANIQFTDSVQKS